MPQTRKPARLQFKQRSDGSPATWIILDGKIQRGTGCGRGELAEAEKKLQAWLAESHRPDTGQRGLAEIDCADVINLYATEVAPGLRSAATIGYQGIPLLKFWSGKSLAEVKGAHCRAYAKWRTETPLPTRQGRPQRFVTAATARQELKLLGRGINHWHREHTLPSLPVVTLPKASSRRERYLERDEAARLIRAIRSLKKDYHHVLRFTLIGLASGTRNSAITGLQWIDSAVGGHIDLQHGIIYRRGSAEDDTSKRRPPYRMDRKLRRHCAFWKAMDGNKLRHVIHYDGEPVARMKNAWSTVVALAGLGPEVTPHVLRHTCVTWALQGREAWKARPAVQSMEIWGVAGMVGASPSTIERVYGHHKPIAAEERKRA